MGFAHVSHCDDKASLHKVLRVVGMEIGLLLDDAPEEIIQWIQVRRVGWPHVRNHVALEIVSKPFLNEYAILLGLLRKELSS